MTLQVTAVTTHPSTRAPARRAQPVEENNSSPRATGGKKSAKKWVPSATPEAAPTATTAQARSFIPCQAAMANNKGMACNRGSTP